MLLDGRIGLDEAEKYLVIADLPPLVDGSA